MSDAFFDVPPVVDFPVHFSFSSVWTNVNDYYAYLLAQLSFCCNENEYGYISRGIVRGDSIWDKLVFRKVREGMGGRLRIVVVGSAPLAGNVLTFARCALGCLVSSVKRFILLYIFFNVYATGGRFRRPGLSLGR